MAVTNWTGLVNLCLDQVREKKSPQARATTQHRIMPGRSPSCQFTPPPSTNPKPVSRQLPSYRLEPIKPLNREICEKIIQETMNKAFEEYVYNSTETIGLCSQLSDDIKKSIKALNYERYRYICIVTVGERMWQDYSANMHFLWDDKNDGYISYSIDDPHYFALAVFIYLYYD